MSHSSVKNTSVSESPRYPQLLIRAAVVSCLTGILICLTFFNMPPTNMPPVASTGGKSTKKIIIWVVAIVVIGAAAYYVLKNYPASSQPATTTGAQAAATTTPPDQVQGQEVKIGTGDEAKPGLVVTVDYVGKLTDGTVFDSSVARKQPLVFTLGAQGIIPGFQVGVNGMKVGGERLLAIPPSLGYGAQQIGSIPPNSTLIFDVKLLKVEQPKPAATTTTAPAKK